MNLYELKKKSISELLCISKNYEIEFLKSENDRLKKTIDEYIYNSEELVAKVLIDKNSPFLKSIIINKGLFLSTKTLASIILLKF